MTEEQREQILTALHTELEQKKYLLETVRDEVLSQDISNYPIFVACKDVLDLGKLIIDKEPDGEWNFFASHLEEFAHKGIIAMEKIDEFRDVYKEHQNELCIFVVENTQGDFVFLP